MLKSSNANFTLYPLLRLSVCLTFGILAGKFLQYDWRIYLTICLAAAILTGVFISGKFALIFLSTAFVSLGGLFWQIENQSITENRIRKIYDRHSINSGDPIEIEGVLQSEPELAVGGFFLLLKTERAFYKNSELKVSGKVRLFAAVENETTQSEYAALNLKYGSRIRVFCALRRADEFLNAGVASRVEMLDQRQIDATGTIKSPLLVEKVEDTEVFAPLAWIYERRENLIVEFRDNFNISTAGVLIASLLGNGYFLDKPTAEVFREGGTFHVLVISGLHITFIGGLTLLFVRFFTNRRLSQFVIAAGFLWGYSIAVGADLPVVRAALMFTILLFSQVIYRSGTLLNALGICVFVLLIWRPNDVFTQSFQLTFASVAAIVAMAFPLIEKLRAIGSWQPSSDAPFPPNVSVRLKRVCEMLYWREAVWRKESARQIWTANLFKSPYLKWLESRNLRGLAQYFVEAVIVSFIVQICLLPFLIVYFHRVSPISVLANLWVGIIIALESFAAVAAIFLAQFSEVMALPLIKLTEFLNWLLVSIPQIFTDNSWANWRLPNYSGAWRTIYFLYFAPVIYLAFALNRWNPFALKSDSPTSNRSRVRFALTILLLLVGIIVSQPFNAPTVDGRLHVDFLDVGQGDAALIRFPNGETMLVDGGGKRNFNRAMRRDGEEAEIFEPDARGIGESVVSPFLWEQGFSQVDYILATHADTDHIQGLSDVAKNFRVRAAFFARMETENAEFNELDAILKKRGIKSAVVARGDVLTFENVKIEVLNPSRDVLPEMLSENNRSLVLRIIYGDRKILLTGDIEKEIEKTLLDAPAFLQSDAIKVAHHGSRTSSTPDFIRATGAKVAVVSVGRESPYGHPHEQVVERWKNAGAAVLTTGENGTVSISTDGRDLQLRTFVKEKIYR